MKKKKVKWWSILSNHQNRRCFVWWLQSSVHDESAGHWLHPRAFNQTEACFIRRLLWIIQSSVFVSSHNKAAAQRVGDYLLYLRWHVHMCMSRCCCWNHEVFIQTRRKMLCICRSEVVLQTSQTETETRHLRLVKNSDVWSSRRSPQTQIWPSVNSQAWNNLISCWHFSLSTNSFFMFPSESHHSRRLWRARSKHWRTSLWILCNSSCCITCRSAAGESLCSCCWLNPGQRPAPTGPIQRCCCPLQAAHCQHPLSSSQKVYWDSDDHTSTRLLKVRRLNSS